MNTTFRLRIIFATIVLLGSGLFYKLKAQPPVVSPAEKKSKSTIFFPNRKRTNHVTVRNGKRLPPGQAKKIYGEKSAKSFAPGQRKKTYNYNHRYHTSSKQPNKNWKHHDKNKKGHDD
jgi:hypothetical protein